MPSTMYTVTSAATIRIGCPLSDAWKAWAVPEKRPRIVVGSPIARVADSMSGTASPSATSGSRLKEIVTDGNWAEWLTMSGVVEASYLAKVLIGSGGPSGGRAD